MNLGNSFISFIIPIYNIKEDLLKRCVNSIEKQYLTQYEIILVNDGSTDESVGLYCKDYAQRNNHIRYFAQTNQGSAAARNTGLDKAKGDYISFVDTDDALSEELFTRIRLYKIDVDFDIVCFDYIVFNQNSRQVYSLQSTIDFSNRKAELYSNIMYVPGALNNFVFGAVWAKCFSRKFIEKHRIRFRSELRKTQDRVFMLDVFILAEKILYFPIPSYHYIINSESITHKMNLKMIGYCKILSETVKVLCEEYNISKNCSKFFSYNIFMEVLQLTYFHVDYSECWFKKRKKIVALYHSFNMGQELKELKLSDYTKMKGKIKLFLFKNHMFWLLSLYFRKKPPRKNVRKTH